MLTLKQAAAIVGVSESYLRRLCRQGKLNAQKIGFMWVVEEEELEKLKEGQ
jgi:excisionase family DNA binding protein